MGVTIVVTFQLVVSNKVGRTRSFSSEYRRIKYLLSNSILIRYPVRTVTYQFVVLSLPMTFYRYTMYSYHLMGISVFEGSVRYTLHGIAYRGFRERLLCVRVLRDQRVIFCRRVTLFQVLGVFTSELRYIYLPM